MKTITMNILFVESFGDKQYILIYMHNNWNYDHIYTGIKSQFSNPCFDYLDFINHTSVYAA